MGSSNNWTCRGNPTWGTEEQTSWSLEVASSETHGLFNTHSVGVFCLGDGNIYHAPPLQRSPYQRALKGRKTAKPAAAIQAALKTCLYANDVSSKKSTSSSLLSWFPFSRLLLKGTVSLLLQVAASPIPAKGIPLTGFAQQRNPLHLGPGRRARLPS